MLEQIRLADYFIFYEDVQFSKGSFVNRVQIKTKAGMRWLTVPLHGLSLGQQIQDVMIDLRKDWRRQHLDVLRQAYADAPFFGHMIALVKDVFDTNPTTIGELSKLSMTALSSYFGLNVLKRFESSASLPVQGSGSQRVLDIVKYLSGSRYITGHGAANYLNHQAFAKAGVQVEYMAYRKHPYPQLHGDFTPYVSALDLVANMGHDGLRFICSSTINWKEFVHHE
jgi:hypothetical protein